MPASWSTAVTLTLLLLAACFAVFLELRPLPARAVRAVDDLGQLLAAAAGAAAAAAVAVRAHRVRASRLRLAWGLLAAGLGSWAAGEAVWSWYELVADREVPFPSAADVGFLGMPLLVGVGLLAWPASTTTGWSRITALLDGVAVCAGCLLLSWTTSLGATWRLSADNLLVLVIAMAYPVGDVLLVSLVVLLLVRAAATHRVPLTALACGLVAFVVADSAFVYGTAVGTYSSGQVTDAGWCAGFLAVAVAAQYAKVGDDPASRALMVPGWPRLALPYLPTALAAGEFFLQLLTTQHVDVVTTLCALVIFLVGLARQFLALAANRGLLMTVRAGQAALRHQAFHDPLTGLPNRALFTERVEEALRTTPVDGVPCAVLFIDLDDFKRVNDSLGHAAGDRLLVEVADRLRHCVRERDTVARLGGDEFAILVTGGAELVHDLATRVVRALASITHVAGLPVTVSASVGVGLHHATATAHRPARPTGDAREAPAKIIRQGDGATGPADGNRVPATTAAPTPPARSTDPTADSAGGAPATVEQLLADADDAMYRAKAGGKNRFVLAPFRAATPDGLSLPNDL